MDAPAAEHPPANLSILGAAVSVACPAREGPVSRQEDRWAVAVTTPPQHTLWHASVLSSQTKKKAQRRPTVCSINHFSHLPHRPMARSANPSPGLMEKDQPAQSSKPLCVVKAGWKETAALKRPRLAGRVNILALGSRSTGTSTVEAGVLAAL